jgi:O-methyltransferase involved in polyketide biosynthesis
MCDPYAARLACDRGFTIARQGTPSRWRSFGIGLRTRFIDEFLESELRDGTIDCVLCLGAGLDARPWRLAFLPNSLRWVEVDFALILDYKHGILNDVAPQCRLERMVADLNDPTDRRRVFEAAASDRTLLLSEGLLFYLPADTVRGLAKEASCCARWMMDISPATALLLESGGDSMKQAIGMGHETRLEGAEILEAVQQNGWTLVASKTFMKDGAPFARERLLKNGWTPDPKTPRLSADDPSGVWLFQPASATKSE